MNRTSCFAREEKMMKKHNILSCIADFDTIMIAGHIRPDGDCVGSCMGIYHYIKALYPEKRTDVRLEEVPDSYKIIPDSDIIRTDYEDDISYDLFISVDVSDLHRLGRALPYFQSAGHTICIDHHISNPGFADENHIEPDASSAAEVLALLMEEEYINEKAAYALYLGMICDSGVFKYDSTSRRTMDAAGMLMEKGIPFTQIINEAFYEKSFVQNQILGRCLMDSVLTEDGKIISCILRRSTMESYGAGNSDLEGIVSQMLLTRGTEVSIFASENPEGSYKFSLRSASLVDVSRIATVFGGGGHIRAAGCTAEGDPREICARMQALVREQLHV